MIFLACPLFFALFARSLLLSRFPKSLRLVVSLLLNMASSYLIDYPCLFPDPPRSSAPPGLPLPLPLDEESIIAAPPGPEPESDIEDSPVTLRVAVVLICGELCWTEASDFDERESERPSLSVLFEWDPEPDEPMVILLDTPICLAKLVPVWRMTFLIVSDSLSRPNYREEWYC